MKKIVVFVSLFMFSCASPMFHHNNGGKAVRLCENDFPVAYVVNGANDTQIRAIDKSAQYWNDVLKKRAFVNQSSLKTKGMNYLFIHVVSPTDIEQNRMNVGEEKAIGLVRINAYNNGCILSAIMWLSSKLSGNEEKERRFETTARHEFGHLIGFEDADNPWSVMYKRLNDDISHPRGVLKEEEDALRCLYNNKNCNTMIERKD